MLYLRGSSATRPSCDPRNSRTTPSGTTSSTTSPELRPKSSAAGLHLWHTSSASSTLSFQSTDPAMVHDGHRPSLPNRYGRTPIARRPTASIPAGASVHRLHLGRHYSHSQLRISWRSRIWRSWRVWSSTPRSGEKHAGGDDVCEMAQPPNGTILRLCKASKTQPTPTGKRRWSALWRGRFDMWLKTAPSCM